LKIYVAGHKGLVGSAIVRAIEAEGKHTWVGRTRSELDLLDRKAVFEFLATEKPDAIVIAAAKVGGIHANNTFPAEFIYDNLMVQNNVILKKLIENIKTVEGIDKVTRVYNS
jgi:GDP-L-fucose synthase